jgi:UTP---glucose-1-phosphate uridylyltransferase
MERLERKRELKRLGALVEQLKGCASDAERVRVLDEDPDVVRWLGSLKVFLTPAHELILKSLIAIGQVNDSLDLERLTPMLEDLLPTQDFYKEMGGVVGYHYTMLTLLFAEQEGSEPEVVYHPPPGTDLSSLNESVREWILEGIVSLPLLAEMYPVGGAGDRLKFCDPESGLPLPAAMLPFSGYTLLERLIRDVQAREYLYFKLFGEQVITPIALMTSHEKDNHRLIVKLCEDKKWFGRPKELFHIFCQPLVPTMDENGQWCLNGKRKWLMKPGGHGVIWKVAQGAKVFEWMKELGRQKILVRQINNPIAGTDHGLLSFCGVGFRGNKAFGFASCPRQVGSAEGMNVLVEKKEGALSHYRLTNIEYCDFAKVSIADVPVAKGSPYSQFPSNTNILFADIGAVEQAILQCPIPGMLVNLKTMSFVTEEGKVEEKKVARLESMMQNLADYFDVLSSPTSFHPEIALRTYLTYNDRKKTISTIKKLFSEEQSLLETPEGCARDFFYNAHDLLTTYCKVQVPAKEGYDPLNPPFSFHYHPALGPLYSIIGQKIKGGVFNLYSELKLEITELYMENLHLLGAFHIVADRVMGETLENGILHYSDRTGSAFLRNVVIENTNGPCEIILHGDAEFVAENVTIRGAMRIEVEAGTRLIAFEENGVLHWKKDVALGNVAKWIYHISDEGIIVLEMAQTQKKQQV